MKHDHPQFKSTAFTPSITERDIIRNLLMTPEAAQEVNAAIHKIIDRAYPAMSPLKRISLPIVESLLSDISGKSNAEVFASSRVAKADALLVEAVPEAADCTGEKNRDASLEGAQGTWIELMTSPKKGSVIEPAYALMNTETFEMVIKSGSVIRRIEQSDGKSKIVTKIFRKAVENNEVIGIGNGFYRTRKDFAFPNRFQATVFVKGMNSNNTCWVKL